MKLGVSKAAVLGQLILCFIKKVPLIDILDMIIILKVLTNPWMMSKFSIDAFPLYSDKECLF